MAVDRRLDGGEVRSQPAIEVAEERAGIEASRVVVYCRPNEWRENLYSVSAAPAPSLATWALLGSGSRGEPAFLYLWRP